MNKFLILKTDIAWQPYLKKLQGYTACLVLILLSLMTIQAFAFSTTEPTKLVDDYLKYIQSSNVKLQAKENTPKEKLRLRSDLVNGKKFWLLQKGQPGRAFGVIQFFQRRTPQKWSIELSTIEGQTANIAVNFDVPVFEGSPWRTDFQLIRVDQQWKIKSFTDLTQRPIKPEANINQVLDTYFTVASNAVERLYSDQLDKDDKQFITSEYSFGAGFWTGQSKRKDLPAGTMFIFFTTKRPISWEIEDARIAGAYGEAAVNFTMKRRDGTSENRRFTFELIQLDKEWFITGHRSKKSLKKVAVHQTTIISDNAKPNEIVQLQIGLLNKQSGSLQELAKASESLWVDARNARRGMGRIIAVTKGFAAGSESGFSWKLADTQVTGDNAIVIIDAVWTKPPAMKMFTGMKLSLQNTVQGWRIDNTQLLRD